MGYFTTIQMLLDIPTSLEVKEREEIDSFLLLLEESNVGEIITKNIKSHINKERKLFLITKSHNNKNNTNKNAY